MTRKKEGKKFTAVSIPTSLFKKVEKRIAGTKFTSVSNYVAYMLREIMADEEEEPFRTEDKEKVKARLKALGYID